MHIELTLHAMHRYENRGYLDEMAECGERCCHHGTSSNYQKCKSLRIYANMNRCINMYSCHMSHLDIVCLRMCIHMYVFKYIYLKYVCIYSCIYIFLHISIMYMNILYVDIYEYRNIYMYIYMYMLLP